jgi:hypothetical protein
MRTTYANLVATLALVVAVGGGGTALAAGHLSKNSVTSKSVKDGSLQGKDLKDGSITATDLAPGTVPAPAPAPAPSAAVVAGKLFAAGNVVTYSPDPAVTQVASVTITAPAAGYVQLTGQAYFRSSPDPDYVNVELREGVSLGLSRWGTYNGTTTNYALMQDYVVVTPVTAGTHTYTLHLSESTKNGAAHSSYWSPQVIAAYFPAGAVLK